MSSTPNYGFDKSVDICSIREIDRELRRIEDKIDCKISNKCPSENHICNPEILKSLLDKKVDQEDNHVLISKECLKQICDNKNGLVLLGQYIRELQERNVQLETQLSNKADEPHYHDGIYVTPEQLSSGLKEIDINNHAHDDRYFTKEQINSQLDSKANSVHTHGNATIGTAGFLNSTDKMKIDKCPTDTNASLANKANTSGSYGNLNVGRWNGELNLREFSDLGLTIPFPIEEVIERVIMLDGPVTFRTHTNKDNLKDYPSTLLGLNNAILEVRRAPANRLTVRLASATGEVELWGKCSYNSISKTFDWQGWNKIAAIATPKEISVNFATGYKSLYQSTYIKTQSNVVALNINCSRTDSSTYFTDMVTIATLPEGYRPSGTIEVNGAANAAGGKQACTVFIQSNGNISLRLFGLTNVEAVFFSVTFLAVK